jgi:uncharacterized protein (DUF1697 family)
MAVFAAFIRGINLGPSKRVAMKDLKAALAAEFEDVQTLLASGNVVLRGGRTAADVERAVARAVDAVAGFTPDVTVRTAREMAAVVDGDPFAGTGLDGKFRLVAFCDAPASADDLRAIEAEHAAGGERLEVAGRDVYILVPDGQARSKLMEALTRHKGGGFATVRNWNTVEKVAALMG